MTAYTVAVGARGKHAKTLVADSEDVVTFGGAAADATITDLKYVEIFELSGVADIYYRFGATATVAGDACDIVPKGTWVKTLVPTSGDTTVHLISAGTAVYSVVSGD